MQTHKYSLGDLDNMLPYEREIYVTMLNNKIQEQNAEAGQQ